jgi:hypothetical protein
VSGGATALFQLHPLPDKTWAGDNAKVAALSSYEVYDGNAVNFLQVLHVEKRPKAAVNRRGDKLVEVSKVTLKQASGNPNDNSWGN